MLQFWVRVVRYKPNSKAIWTRKSHIHLLVIRLYSNTIPLAIEYPEYQNHEELDIEIEKTERMESGCFESSSCSKSNSADSGHQPSDDQISDKNEKKGKNIL